MFVQSKRGAALIYKYPILLDACANEMQRKGDAMMSKWAEVITFTTPQPSNHHSYTRRVEAVDIPSGS